VQGKVKKTYQQEENSRRQTKIAYPDMVAKPPRDIARKQVRTPEIEIAKKHGITQAKNRLLGNMSERRIERNSAANRS
jgi:hypothetical protein